METFKDYFILIVPLAVGGFTLTLKFVIFSVKHGVKWEYLLTHGHMPSFHTAFTISTLTSIGYYAGTATPIFALAAIFAIVIIDDAIRLRVYLGDQGRYLNKLVEELPINKKKFPRLKERIGHRMSEVIVGGIIGFGLTLILAKLLESL
ncbi:MAG: acid phosphatase [Candidatus Moranbacteria bacterium CG_4_10_14_3_um_filter_44_15]|nr:MAG: acid phosphatase [Candidatus Moranbacteria bacterium CG06_land_8_20_14_3_00_43_56]PIV83500.1 MAG: acid phosphatase [Candidatus Moranbacteria bacterium CG17_big_fil_post_rev_8_21_14_2_50_44_12]PIW93374.1 MAG: acid phosphatase [Candidatus Moranbacteria bacterium CG_4_8_14_3_um_filter_43_15]PIX91170.1 MAG: acid phosphatase [Candidatus Moranbacteria bacterium CG_4_10_14_3_um_filter_44_15]PJA86365.1 MAG: acid phosphatase [Candidatus Moranbacteria bacterium CG_4_9_14_3_um_filter_44_28]